MWLIIRFSRTLQIICSTLLKWFISILLFKFLLLSSLSLLYYYWNEHCRPKCEKKFYSCQVPPTPQAPAAPVPRTTERKHAQGSNQMLSRIKPEQLARARNGNFRSGPFVFFNYFSAMTWQFNNNCVRNYIRWLF